MTESLLQQQIYQWYNNTFCLKHHNPRHIIFAVPNGGHREMIDAIILKRTGVVPGVSDLIVIRPNEIVFVEVKRPEGIQSEKQKKFERTVTSLGFKYYLVYSLKDFKNIFGVTK